MEFVEEFKSETVELVDKEEQVIADTFGDDLHSATAAVQVARDEVLKARGIEATAVLNVDQAKLEHEQAVAYLGSAQASLDNASQALSGVMARA